MAKAFKLIIYLTILNSTSLFSQIKEVENFIKYTRNHNYNEKQTEIHLAFFKKNDSILYKKLSSYLYLIENKGVYKTVKQKLNLKLDSNINDPIISFFNYLNKGLNNFYHNENSDSKTLKLYLKALEIAKKLNNNFLLSETYKRILEYHNTIIYIRDFSYKEYLKSYREIAFDSIEIEISNYYDVSIGIKNSDQTITNEEFLKIKKIENKITIPFYRIPLKIMMGNYHENEGDFKRAIKIYTEALNLTSNEKKGHEILPKIGIEMNIGVFYYYKKEYKTALKYLKLKNNYLGKLIKRKQVYIDYWLARTYKELKQYDSAYVYLKKSRDGQFNFNQEKHLVVVNDIQEKYQTAEKEKQILKLEKENLETEAKRIKNRNFLMGSLLFILLAGTIGILSLKNSKRKRKLAEQEKELEAQKNLTLLKEQELTTINAMVEGQEKERKRVAEDLHDNLGSVLATLKLHFENLKINNEKKKINQETLFNKTENLIDEAYLKVRSIAHAKNAGVIANQGLLVAIQMMAEKISSADKIKIEVIDFGLDKRLENSLEISIFRIIQELLTNIIKHADAKNATINISLYDKNLNIIIEDNGKGFDIKKVNLKNGMGINSIKTRVEHLKGTFEVDSTINRGTSVIINIPVE